MAAMPVKGIYITFFVCLCLREAHFATKTLLVDQTYWIAAGHPIKLRTFDVGDQVRLSKLERAGYDFLPCSSDYNILTFTAQEINFSHHLAECVNSNCEEVQWENMQLASINCSGSMQPPTAIKIRATFQIQPSGDLFEAQHAVNAETFKVVLDTKCTDPEKQFAYTSMAFFSTETVEYCYANISSIKSSTGVHLEACARSDNCLSVHLSDQFGWPCKFSQGWEFTRNKTYSNSIDKLLIFYSCDFKSNGNVTRPTTATGPSIEPTSHASTPVNATTAFLVLFIVFLLISIILAVLLILTRARLVKADSLTSVNTEQPTDNNNVVQKRSKTGRGGQHVYSTTPYATRTLIASDTSSLTPPQLYVNGEMARASTNTLSTYCDSEINQAFPEKMREKKNDELDMDDYEPVNHRRSATPSELYIEVL